jgi:uncharacterized protein YlaI
MGNCKICNNETISFVYVQSHWSLSKIKTYVCDDCLKKVEDGEIPKYKLL